MLYDDKSFSGNNYMVVSSFDSEILVHTKYSGEF
jgi:hypothetical protein